MKTQCTCCSRDPQPPKPHGPVPSPRQLQWHQLEFYGFLHFTVNTFTDQEWGYGHEDADLFHPSDFDADQIAETAKMAGMKGLILTCKHHDGFCLWPSLGTKHSVRSCSWQKGKGNVVLDISRACARVGLKFGTYLSPWDRNHTDYGRPAYLRYYRKQLTDLMTNFGPIFETWFDGANGGNGYYGGAREARKIDPKKYYGWDKTWQIVRRIQPQACIFSDGGPDVRWVGNEEGIAGDPCWSTINAKKIYPGLAELPVLNRGERDGENWLPFECDVSIRPGWFYHRSEDERVRTPENLLDLYFKSVGRGGSFLLNLPPDRRGQIHENDVKSLRGFRRLLDATFRTDLSDGATATASSVRGGSSAYGAGNVLDGRGDTYWATDDSVRKASLALEFKRPVKFSVVDLREYLPLGQRVDAFAVDYWSSRGWQVFARGQNIGCRRLLRGKPVSSRRLRLRITHATACPAISRFGLYLES